MNCKKCGSPLTENDKFCKNCGTLVDLVLEQVPVISAPVQNPVPGIVNPVLEQSPTITAPVQNPVPVIGQQPTNKSKNTLLYIIAGIAALAVIGSFIYGVIMAQKDNDKLDSTQEEKEVVENKNSYEVNFEGFTFKIPTDLVYRITNASDSFITISNEDDTWAASITPCEGSYTKLLSNITGIKPKFESIGIPVTEAEEKKINNRDFIVLESSSNAKNSIYAYTKANSMYFFGLEALNINNEFDYTIFEKISSILDSAEYTGKTNNLVIDNIIDMSGISDLAK